MTATERAVDLTIAAARAASERKALEIIALDVSEQLVLTDVFLIVAGRNERQVGAIVDAVEEALHKMGAKPLRREGKSEGRWVLVDFGDIVVHVQREEDREFYALERLWKDCPAIELPEDARGGDGDTSEYDAIDSFGFTTGLYHAAAQAQAAEEARDGGAGGVRDAADVNNAEGEARLDDEATDSAGHEDAGSDADADEAEEADDDAGAAPGTPA